MARKTIEVLTSDLSGEELKPGQGESISFSFENSSYQIDLTNDEAKAFRSAVARYVSSATKVSGRTGGTRKASGSGRSPDELDAIRTWLRAEGYEISDRGRVRADLIKLYDENH